MRGNSLSQRVVHVISENKLDRLQLKPFASLFSRLYQWLYCFLGLGALLWLYYSKNQWSISFLETVGNWNPEYEFQEKMYWTGLVYPIFFLIFVKLRVPGMSVSVLTLNWPNAVNYLQNHRRTFWCIHSLISWLCDSIETML